MVVEMLVCKNVYYLYFSLFYVEMSARYIEFVFSFLAVASCLSLVYFIYKAS